MLRSLYLLQYNPVQEPLSSPSIFGMALSLFFLQTKILFVANDLCGDEVQIYTVLYDPAEPCDEDSADRLHFTATCQMSRLSFLQPITARRRRMFSFCGKSTGF